MSEEKKIPVQLQPGAASNPIKEAAPLNGVSVSGIENVVVPTHSEVVVPQPLQAQGVVPNPVPKLPDAAGMQPNPPNFDSLGQLTFPVGIEDIRAARVLRQGNPQAGITWAAAEVVREEGKLDKAA